MGHLQIGKLKVMGKFVGLLRIGLSLYVCVVVLGGVERCLGAWVKEGGRQ